MPPEATVEKMQEHFARAREVIRAEDMWERVPEGSREFPPENLENL